jgi:hypothetical protein
MRDSLARETCRLKHCYVLLLEWYTSIYFSLIIQIVVNGMGILSSIVYS